MDAKQRFGRQLRAIRKQRGLTQERLAELIDRSVDAISNMERGISLPSYETVGRLSEKLGIPLNDLNDWFDQAAASIADPERAQLEATLQQIARMMDKPALRIAVEQMQVLARHLGT